MRRDPGLGDLIALVRIVLLLWRDRPAIVHTHAAKGGTLGRVATILAYPAAALAAAGDPHLPWPLTDRLLLGAHRRLLPAGRKAARARTDVLLAVSSEVRDELVELGVAPASQFRVMPLGFDLAPFTGDVDRAASASASCRAGAPATRNSWSP